MCDQGPNNNQVLTKGPQGSSSLVGTMSRNAGAIFGGPSRWVREHNPPSPACTQRDRWALVHMTPWLEPLCATTQYQFGNQDN
jgi:hypothetical protein